MAGPRKLRTGQLEQTKLCYTNSISLGLASEWKNSARWCPTQAADFPDKPPSTTQPDASFSGDPTGRRRPEGGQALCGPHLHLGHPVWLATAHPLTFPDSQKGEEMSQTLTHGRTWPFRVEGGDILVASLHEWPRHPPQGEQSPAKHFWVMAGDRAIG